MLTWMESDIFIGINYIILTLADMDFYLPIYTILTIIYYVGQLYMDIHKVTYRQHMHAHKYAITGNIITVCQP